MLKIALLLTSLSLIACSKLPPFPEVWQCAYSIKFNKFRCVNTKTKAKVNLRRDDSSMEAAQCLSAEDYIASERWVANIKELAERRCK
jgi:hypothetical protein